MSQDLRSTPFTALPPGAGGADGGLRRLGDAGAVPRRRHPRAPKVRPCGRSLRCLAHGPLRDRRARARSPSCNSLITNDLEKAADDQLLYAAVCHERGGIIDDVTVYRLADRVLMVANAVQPPADLGLADRAQAGRASSLEDRSPELAQIAFQGPQAEEVLRAPLVDGDLRDGRLLPSHAPPRGKAARSSSPATATPARTASRSTCRRVRRRALGRACSRRAAPIGVEPIGLGARDTLRMEMCYYALYGNELSRDVTPLEAGIGWTVKLKKTRLRRQGGAAAAEGAGPAPHARRLRGRGQAPAAPRPDDSRRRPRGRRGDERRLLPVAEAGDGAGVRSARAGRRSAPSSRSMCGARELAARWWSGRSTSTRRT